MSISSVDQKFVSFLYVRIAGEAQSVSTVSDYRLDDQAIQFQSPAEARDFSSSLCVQTSSEAHLATCPMGTGGPFPGSKAQPWRDTEHSPHLVLRS
jgi:hypothetical protein